MRSSKNLIILMISGLMIIVALGLSILAYSVFNDVVNDYKNINNVNLATKTYSGNGVSFNYPANWILSTTDSGGGIPGTKIISISKIDVNTTDHVAPTFQVTIIPFVGYLGQDIVEPIGNGSDFKLISNSTVKVNDEIANEIISISNDPFYHKTMRSKEVNFIKNGNYYSLFFQALDEDFDKEKSDSEIIFNSFKLN